MGKNSIFDDIGLGASDLGLAEDPDKVAARQRREQEAAQAKIDKEKADAEAEATAKEEKERMSQTRSRTLLTGSEGVDDENLKISRRTLLGS